MKDELAKLYTQFLKELYEYENDPHRSRTNFFDREAQETFEGFMSWVLHGYINSDL